MSRPENHPLIAWLDLETTGSRPDDRILEVGIALTDRELEVVADYSAVVFPHGWEGRLVPVVETMHRDSGLSAEVALTDLTIAKVDRRVARFLARYAEIAGADPNAHIPLAGSGVSHFDRRFIRAEMPETDRMLSYWAYDVGAMRRFLKWWGIKSRPTRMPTHRALDDAYAAIEQARAFRDTLRLGASTAGMIEHGLSAA